MFIKSLLSNGRLFLLHYSAFQVSCHNTFDSVFDYAFLLTIRMFQIFFILTYFLPCLFRGFLEYLAAQLLVVLNFKYRVVTFNPLFYIWPNKLSMVYIGIHIGSLKTLRPSFAKTWAILQYFCFGLFNFIKSYSWALSMWSKNRMMFLSRLPFCLSVRQMSAVFQSECWDTRPSRWAEWTFMRDLVLASFLSDDTIFTVYFFVSNFGFLHRFIYKKCVWNDPTLPSA